MHKGKSLSTFHEIIHPIIVLHYNAFMLTNVTRTVNSQLIPRPTLLLKMLSLVLFRTGIHAHPQVVYCNCAKFYQYQFIC